MPILYSWKHCNHMLPLKAMSIFQGCAEYITQTLMQILMSKFETNTRVQSIMVG